MIFRTKNKQFTLI